jgi:hypothetical protein
LGDIALVVFVSWRESVMLAIAGTADVTKAVVAIWVVFVPAVAVGAVGVPVKAGEARFALRLSAVVTKAVVAICVVDVPAVAVGAAGVPVKVGLARLALRLSAVVTKAVVAS